MPSHLINPVSDPISTNLTPTEPPFNPCHTPTEPVTTDHQPILKTISGNSTEEYTTSDDALDGTI